MAKKRVFVFCIGGTGLRVMKSIVMLLSAGYDSKGYSLVPVLIDPHQDLKEKTQLDDLIDSYIKIYDYVTGQNTGNVNNSLAGFWSTEIERWWSLDNQQNPTNSSMASQLPFGSYLEIGGIDDHDINRFLLQTLYSEANLNNQLSVGFKGNPNVGTVVLGDMIKGADWFDAVQSHFEKDDRIFIISSIFGGTGASGYPLLEKMIRNSVGHPILQKALMGAVTVLPYFALEDPTTTGSSIDSSSFLTKTKAALAYYEKTVLSDYLYYIGESSQKKSYQNDEAKQDNPAHFIELVAATALFDFLGKERQNTTQYLSRAIRDNQEALDVVSAGDGYKDVVKVLADMRLLQKLVTFIRSESSFPLKKTRGLGEIFYKDEPFIKFEEFLERYSMWYEQIANNKRGFAPLTDCDKMCNPVKGISISATEPSYVLRMIIESNKMKREDNLQLRHLLESAYKAINYYTRKIVE